MLIATDWAILGGLPEGLAVESKFIFDVSAEHWQEDFYGAMWLYYRNVLRFTRSSEHPAHRPIGQVYLNPSAANTFL